MDKRLIDWDNAENAYRNALRGLKTTIEETIFNIIPFNEDKRFIFEDDGVLDDYDLPEIWKYDSETSDILRGFEWYEDCRGYYRELCRCGGNCYPDSKTCPYLFARGLVASLSGDYETCNEVVGIIKKLRD